jgi:hypothetical protein
MNSITTCIVVVCLCFLGAIGAANAQDWNLTQAAFVASKTDAPVAKAPKTKVITKVKPEKIFKCRPTEMGYESAAGFDPAAACILPMERPRGWALDAEALFGRTKAKVRYVTGLYTPIFNTDDVDLNADMGLPDHAVIPTFSARYRFGSKWSVRYSIMPMVNSGDGSVGKSFTFGTVSIVPIGQPTRVKWERTYQRAGLTYDALRTYNTRVSVFGEFVRVDDRINFIQVGTGGSTMDNDLNMGMAGVEFEKCLKTTRSCNTLSLECKAGVAFGDEAFGSDMSTGVKYTIPLNNGRWGFVKGGYRYLTYKKKYSDARMLDTCIEGGFLQMGFVF